MSEPTPPQEIELTLEILDKWPSYKKLLEEGKIVLDCKGKLRYPHGAPLGKLTLTKIRKDGTPVYQEFASEWFDPDSPKAQKFVWPE